MPASCAGLGPTSAYAAHAHPPRGGSNPASSEHYGVNHNNGQITNPLLRPMARTPLRALRARGGAAARPRRRLIVRASSDKNGGYNSDGGGDGNLFERIAKSMGVTIYQVRSTCVRPSAPHKRPRVPPGYSKRVS